MTFKKFLFETLCGKDGTNYRPGVKGFFLDALEGAFGFFGLVAVACTFVQIGHWVGLW